MIYAATRTFEIVYISLLYGNHPSASKFKGELMIPLVVMGWIHLALVLVLLNIYKIYLGLKSGFRIIHNFSTIHSKVSV
jgi:hypothetical protein